MFKRDDINEVKMSKKNFVKSFDEIILKQYNVTV